MNAIVHVVIEGGHFPVSIKFPDFSRTFFSQSGIAYLNVGTQILSEAEIF